MDSYVAYGRHGDNLQLKEGSNNTIPIGIRSSRRTVSCSSSFFETLSSSSSSSFSSNPAADSPSSPITPLHFSGVPFSWEQHPGIPKKSTYFRSHSKNKDSTSLILLPLPPPVTLIPSKRFNFEAIFPIRKKKNSQGNFRRDPFIAALMECSKDHQDAVVDHCWKGTKVSRTLCHPFSFIDLYSSCKNSGAVSASKVLLPRSSRGSYDLLTRRAG